MPKSSGRNLMHEYGDLPPWMHFWERDGWRTSSLVVLASYGLHQLTAEKPLRERA